MSDSSWWIGLFSDIMSTRWGQETFKSIVGVEFSDLLKADEFTSLSYEELSQVWHRLYTPTQPSSLSLGSESLSR